MTAARDEGGLEPTSPDEGGLDAATVAKLAAAPNLKLPPPPHRVNGPDGRAIEYVMQDMTFARKARNRISQLIYNTIITHIPSHTIRLGFLRLFGATIGKDSSILRGTHVLDIEFLSIGECSSVGFRCMLDARAGLSIGDNCTIASDVHIIGGGHDFNDPDFLPIPIPTVIEDYVWIGSRAMILPAHIHRGGVVAAQALVTKDIGELEVVGGVPAKVITKRNADALKYNARYRPLFY